MISIEDVNKWKKYKLLTHLGFIEDNYLQNAIKRFQRSELESLLKFISSFFSEGSNTHKLIIIKFVTKEGFGQLYNLRVEQQYSNEWILQQIFEHTVDSVIQYWACTVDIAPETGNFSGRYLADAQNYAPQIIEIIWWTSPRFLESNLHQGIYPYSRHIRLPGQLSYTTEEIILPKSRPFSISVVNYCMQSIIELINSHINSIQILESAISACGLSTYSLEFKFENGKGTFIDWDTTNDKRVLNEFPI